MKTTFKYLLFITLAYSVYSCSPKGDGSIKEVIVDGNKMYVFSLNELKADTARLSISNFVENCELVQLETHDDTFVNPWFTTITDKYIGIRQNIRKPYMLFDRAGKFLCKVGAVGQGPGEYAFTPYDDIIDDKNELIILSPFLSDKILVYNTSGRFLRNIEAPLRLYKAKIFLTDNILTVVHLPSRDDKAIALQFDVNTGVLLKELAPPTHLMQNVESEIFNTRNVSGIFDFASTRSDTLFHFDIRNNKILPFFTMTFDSSEKPYKQYFQLNKDLIITLVFGKGLIASDLKNRTSSWIKVVNDYYGNIPAPTYIVQLRNGYWVHNIQPEQLIDDIENRLAQSGCTENDKQILNKTLSTLKDGDNNVVFIGKLKSGVNSKLW